MEITTPLEESWNDNAEEPTPAWTTGWPSRPGPKPTVRTSPSSSRRSPSSGAIVEQWGQSDLYPEVHQCRRPRRRAAPPLRAVAAREVPQRPNAPHVERRGIASMTYTGGKPMYDTCGTTRSPSPTPGSTRTSCTPHKRHVAAVGFDRDDMTLSPITYDEMRPGCYDPKAAPRGHGRQPRRGVAVLPDHPALLRADVRRGHRQGPRSACVQAYNDWMVEEWCGDSGGRLIPLCMIPLWDVELAVAEIQRNAARGVHAVAFSEIPSNLGLPDAALRLLGSVLPRVRRHRDAGLHAHRLVVADAGHLARRAARGAGHAQLRQRDVVDGRLPVLRRALSATRS